MIVLQYEHVPDLEELRHLIRQCEGNHTQQAIFSTFHDALTQVCFGCLKVRSTIYRTDEHLNRVTDEVPLTGFQEDEGRTRLEVVS